MGDTFPQRSQGQSADAVERQDRKWTSVCGSRCPHIGGRAQDRTVREAPIGRALEYIYSKQDRRTAEEHDEDRPMTSRARPEDRLRRSCRWRSAWANRDLERPDGGRRSGAITEVMLDKAEHPPRHGVFSSTPSSNHSRHSSPRCDLIPDARRRAREDHLSGRSRGPFRRLGASQRNHMILQSGTHSGSTIFEKRHSQTKRQPTLYGGEGGIRTHGTVTRTTVFETAPIDHSGTSPQRWSEGPWSRPPVDRGGPLTQGSLLAKRSLACPRYFPTLPV